MIELIKLDELNSLSTQEILAVLGRALNNEVQFDKSVLHLAEDARAYAASQKNTKNSKEERLIWAKIADKAYAYFCTEENVDEVVTHIDLSLMYMRVNLINDYGVDENNEILNVKTIGDWCLSIVATIEQHLLENISQLDISQLPKETIRQLRRLRTRLSVCEQLKYVHAMRLDSRVLYFLPLKKDLP